jgi:hypothetical protein
MKALALTGIATIEAVGENPDGSPKLPRFKMLAHTFKPVRVGGWYHPIVIVRAGLTIPRQSLPIRFNHSSEQGVGHTTSVAIEGGKLVAEGVISRVTEAARDVIESAKNGFPWQASVGTSVDRYSFVEAKRTATVNGVTYEGPLYVAHETTLNEISFVDLGADDKTSASVAAGRASASGETLAEHGARVRREIQAAQERARVKRQIKAATDRARARRDAELSYNFPMAGDATRRQSDALVLAERERQAAELARVRREAGLSEPTPDPARAYEGRMLAHDLRRR